MTEFPQPPAWVREALARGLVIPAHPLALTADFARDPSKSKQWIAFLKKGMLAETPPPFASVVELLQAFLMPPTTACHCAFKTGQACAG